jgi:hypothetical protein
MCPRKSSNNQSANIIIFFSCSPSHQSFTLYSRGPIIYELRIRCQYLQAAKRDINPTFCPARGDSNFHSSWLAGFIHLSVCVCVGLKRKGFFSCSRKTKPMRKCANIREISQKIIFCEYFCLRKRFSQNFATFLKKYYQK